MGLRHPARASSAATRSLDWITLGFGSANGKVFQETQLAGAGAHGSVTGAYATRGRQHLDFDTLQEHAAPDTTSDLAFRGILADRSSAVWRGMIKVDPGAQRTDAFQESRNLLLSKTAHADAIPGLEILADDVRCTHAAAIAQIDPRAALLPALARPARGRPRSGWSSRASCRRSSSASRRAPCARPSARRSSAGSPPSSAPSRPVAPGRRTSVCPAMTGTTESEPELREQLGQSSTAVQGAMTRADDRGRGACRPPRRRRLVPGAPRRRARRRGRARAPCPA